MANTQALCTSFLGELLTGTHDLTPGTGDVLKAALYEATATKNASTTAYNVTGEVSGAGYVAGGVAVTNAVAPTSANTSATAGAAYWTPSASVTFSAVTLVTAFDAVVIYNSTKADSAVSVHTFGSQTVTAGTFSLTMPVNGAGTALIQLATT
jgi:hypothetical protein